MGVEIIKYAYDDTGLSEENHVQGEEHRIYPATLFVLPRGGCYYRDSITITDLSTGLPLKEGEGLDYVFGNFYQEATLEVGQSIYGTIFFERELDTTISIEAQYIGGKYSVDTVGIGELLNQINTNGSKVLWDEIIKPNDGIKPTEHTHNTNTDLKGTQEVVEAILKVAENILVIGKYKSEGVSVDWVESRLSNQVRHIPDADTVLVTDDFDNRTFLFIGHSSPVALTVLDTLVVSQSLFLYAVESGCTVVIDNPSATVIHGQVITGGVINLNKGCVYKVDPIATNEYLVTEHN